MIWQDVLLTEWADKNAVAAALGQAFAVPAEAVAVVDMPTHSLAPFEPSIQIAVERFRERGDVRMRLLVHDFGTELSTSGEDATVTLERVRRLCRALHTSAMIDAETSDPEAWLLIHPDGAVERVELGDGEDGTGERTIVRQEAGPAPPERAGSSTVRAVVL